MPQTDDQTFQHNDVYRLKACPHCGMCPTLLKRETDFELSCLHHPGFAVRQFSWDHSLQELNMMIDDWNEDYSFIQLGADPVKAKSRVFFDVQMKVQHEPATNYRH